MRINYFLTVLTVGAVACSMSGNALATELTREWPTWHEAKIKRIRVNVNNINVNGVQFDSPMCQLSDTLYYAPPGYNAVGIPINFVSKSPSQTGYEQLHSLLMTAAIASKTVSALVDARTCEIVDAVIFMD